RTAPPRRPCVRAPPSAAKAAQPGRTRSGTVRRPASPRSANGLQQRHLPGPGWPLLEHLLPLPRPRAKLAEAVHRNIKSQEALTHRREQEDAAADELLLVEFHLHLRAAGERH